MIDKATKKSPSLSPSLTSAHAQALLGIMQRLQSVHEPYDCVVIADASLNHIKNPAPEQSIAKGATCTLVILPYQVAYCVNAYDGNKRIHQLENQAVRSGIDLAHEFVGDSARIHVITDSDMTIDQHMKQKIFGPNVDCTRPFKEKTKSRHPVTPFADSARAHSVVDIIATATRQSCQRTTKTLESFAQQGSWSEEFLNEKANEKGRSNFKR